MSKPRSTTDNGYVIDPPSHPVARPRRDRPARPQPSGGVRGWISRFRSCPLTQYRVVGLDARTQGSVIKTFYADDLEHAGQICRMVGIDIRTLVSVK
ncbi:MAG: hypothetical protein ACYTGQ_09265 [Planctomycetota bacterium]|jgi:hypothetical protein